MFCVCFYFSWGSLWLHRPKTPNYKGLNKIEIYLFFSFKPRWSRVVWCLEDPTTFIFLFYQLALGVHSQGHLMFGNSPQGRNFSHQVGIPRSKEEEGGIVNTANCYSKLIWSLLTEVINRTRLLVDTRVGSGQLEAPHPCLGMYILPTIPIQGAISSMQPWNSRVLLRPPGLGIWLNPIKPLYKVLRFWAVVWTLLFLQPTRTSLRSKSPFLWKLPPTNRDGAASFFGLSLTSLYGDSFEFSPQGTPEPTESCC